MPHTLEKILGESRVAVLRTLESEKQSVTEIVDKTGLSQPNVSNHLARLREQGLVTATRRGKHVYYAISDASLVGALLTLPRPQDEEDKGEREVRLSELRENFEPAALALDHEKAMRLLNTALSHSVPWQDIYLKIFDPLLVRIGDLWEAGELSVSEEHAASGLVERLMSHIASLRVPLPSGLSSITVACVEGEYHQIGARMISDLLSSEGWDVSFLGANVPTESLVAYVQKYKPAVLAVSASSMDRVGAIQELVARLSQVPADDRPEFVLGGCLIRLHPEVAQRLNVAAPDPFVAVVRFIEMILPERSPSRD